MTAGISYSRGAIVLVPFPFTDQSGAKVRPALVVSPDSFNMQHSDVVLAAITSQISALRDYSIEITLDHDDVASGRIKQASIIKVSKLFTCEQDSIKRQVASLRSVKLNKVLKALQIFFG